METINQDQHEDEANRFYKFSKRILGANEAKFDKQKDIDTRNYANMRLESDRFLRNEKCWDV